MASCDVFWGMPTGQNFARRMNWLSGKMICLQKIVVAYSLFQQNYTRLFSTSSVDIRIWLYVVYRMFCLCVFPKTNFPDVCFTAPHHPWLHNKVSCMPWKPAGHKLASAWPLIKHARQVTASCCVIVVMSKSMWTFIFYLIYCCRHLDVIIMQIDIHSE